MEAKLSGMTRGRRIASLVVYAVLLLVFMVLAVLSAMMGGFGPVQWIVAGTLLLSTALWVAWEIRVLVLFRAGRVDGRESSGE